MRHENEVESFDVSGLTVRIVQDTDAESPRENDNLGTMICWHRNYILGDYTNKDLPYDSPSDFQEWVDKDKETAIVLPLYLYDHSGITMSCSPFSCPWDSGQIGYIYITKEKIRKEYSVKKITKKLLERVTGYLVSEVKEYDDYLTGQCYGYVIEDEDGEHIDSCWGFIGDLDYVRKEATDVAKHAAERINARETEMETFLNTAYAL